MAIAIRDLNGGLDEHDRVSNVGAVPPGTTKTVPLTTTFESGGRKDLRVVVFGTNEATGETVKYRYPIQFTVDEQHPQIGVDTDQSVAGVASNGTVTIANGLGEAVTDLEVRVHGESVGVLDRRTVQARLEAGQTTALPFRFRPEAAGNHDLTATINYTVSANTERTTTETTTLEVEPVENAVDLGTTVQTNENGRQLSVTVINRGNAPIKNALISVNATETVFQGALAETVGPGESKQVQFSETIPQSGLNGSVTADYEIGNRQQRASKELAVPALPTAIKLTGIEISEQGDRVHISGSTSNIGTTDVESVLVSVKPTKTVSPASPNKNYFVGTVPASDFVSFDLFATTTPNTTSIPIEVSYLVDGERRQQTVEVGVESEAQANVQRSSSVKSGSQNLIPIVVGGIVVTVVVGIMIVAWRNADVED